MAGRETVLTLRLRDLVSANATRISTSLGGLTRSLVGIDNRTGVFRAMGRNMRQVQYASRDIATGLSLPAGAATWYGAKAVYDFEKTGNAMQAVGRLTDKQRESLSAYAQDLNELFPFKNADILSGAFELGRAGQNFEQIMGSLKSTLNVATAGDLGLQETADIMTNVAQAMRLPLGSAEETEKSMIRVGDALAYAATRSNTDIRKMGVTFKYAAPIFAATGQDIERMAAMTAVLANNGIKGSDAGTGLRFMLTRLLKPSKDALKALDLLNIKVGDYITGAKAITRTDLASQLAIDGIDISNLGIDSAIDDILADKNINKSAAKMTAELSKLITGKMGKDGIVDSKALSDSLSSTLSVLGTQIDLNALLTEIQSNPKGEALLPRIFGVRHGAKMMSLLAGDFVGKEADLRAQMKGAADEMSRIRLKGVVGDVAEMNAAFENLFITVAKAGVLDQATSMINSFTDTIRELSKANPDTLKFGTYAIAGLAVLGPLGLALSGVIGLFRVATGSIGLLAGALSLLTGTSRAAAVAQGMQGVGGGSGKGGFMRGLMKSLPGIATAAYVGSAGRDALGLERTASEQDQDKIRRLSDRLNSARAYIKSIEGGAGSNGYKQAEISHTESKITKIEAELETIKAKYSGAGQASGNAFGDGMTTSMQAQHNKLAAEADAALRIIQNAVAAGVKVPLRTGVSSGLTSGGAQLDGNRRTGGRMKAGGVYGINESGLEIFSPSTNGYMHNARDSKQIASGNAGTTVNIYNTISGAGDPAAVAQKINDKLSSVLGRSRSISMQGRPVTS